MTQEEKDLYARRMDLVARYHAETDEVAKLRLKLELSLEKAHEIGMAYDRYNWNDLGRSIASLEDFLGGKKETLTFWEFILPMSFKGDWQS